jgi:hypothetical protein
MRSNPYYIRVIAGLRLTVILAILMIVSIDLAGCNKSNSGNISKLDSLALKKQDSLLKSPDRTKVKKQQQEEDNPPGRGVEYNGVIDLQSIDANKDGFLYECPKHLNVLSDEPGICPSDSAVLKRSPVYQVREKLLANHFQVK